MYRDRLAAAVIAIAAAALPVRSESRGAGEGEIGQGEIDERAAARAPAAPAAVTSTGRAAGSAGPAGSAGSAGSAGPAGSAGSAACETDGCRAARSAGPRETLRDASGQAETGTSSADARGTAPDRRSRRTRAVRAELVDQLDDQARSVESALATVQDRLAGVAAARAHRLAIALRVGRAITGGDAPIAARRLAAARLLLAHDRDERALLLDEIAGLTAARARIAAERTRAAAIALPDRLAWPAAGSIARHFGTLVHERSHATLSRRGIDLEVAERSAVVAPAAGTVRYAGTIRGLDRGVIIDHGDYVTVIAKLGDLALPVDATVAIGDRLGRAAHHRVYLEVRAKLGPGGLPIDPEPLLGPKAEDRARPARRSPRAGLD